MVGGPRSVGIRRLPVRLGETAHMGDGLISGESCELDSAIWHKCATYKGVTVPFSRWEESQ